ncbi:Tetratricopeptide TPR_1 repeat-containing protein [Sulfuricurvum kujiense DSM 16994]|uniref:Tetratricopeptide TPR_1 repeat-containing protein n=1 Tax=Sulfuricurvum kujiense (strain ATCC BAA-921 / DSM 16994 / JCM 11577 / YK-1) TaxID=709032 RepID=E4U243_SULKY|nr:tetratricopeptide repeat protein [Sulfuricurvum kujiense]ADR34600.1 Tetratricopeptide TPR_1 repeat-containing protein [Sulfuricurvum kujiense DSM 16994]
MKTLFKAVCLASLLLTSLIADDRFEEGRRYFIRGIAAIEMAKSDKELSGAAEQFAKATEIAPELSAAWYNLGSVQSKLGRYKEAMYSYQRYLDLNPKAEDAPKIRDEIIKLEYRMEQAAKVTSLAGTWIGHNGWGYTLEMSGNHLKLTANRSPDDDDVISTYTLVGKVPVSAQLTEIFDLEISGVDLSGKWSRNGFQADKCTIPPDGGDVTGEIFYDQNKIVLRYTRTKYSAATQVSVFDDFCINVKVTDRKSIEDTFVKQTK